MTRRIGAPHDAATLRTADLDVLHLDATIFMLERTSFIVGRGSAANFECGFFVRSSSEPDNSLLLPSVADVLEQISEGGRGALTYAFILRSVLSRLVNNRGFLDGNGSGDGEEMWGLYSPDTV